MQNELNERQSKRTPGGREEDQEGSEVESPNRKQRKIVAIYATNRKRWKLQDENEGRKVYAKQQTKQSRQLICWQRKGESSCPNIYSIYKAGHREHAGHTHTHTARNTQDTGHRTQDMGHGQTISCLLAKKIYVPKDKSLDKQRGRKPEEWGARGVEWSNILRFLFN